MPSSLNTLYALATLRFKLLIRQKLLQASLLLILGATLFSWVLGELSYMNPQRFYWDFVLGFQFVLQIFLASYLGAQLYADEEHRKTLQLYLSYGLSRSQWIIGQVLGLAMAMFFLSASSFLIAAVLASLTFESAHILLPFQQSIFLWAESVVLVNLSFFISLWVRPMIALLATFCLTFFVHMADDIEKFFKSGLADGDGFLGAGLFKPLLAVRYLLPPLNWLDIRIFQGVIESITWSKLFLTLVVILAWNMVLLVASQLRLNGKDI